MADPAAEQVHVRSRAEWRAWLAEHHARRTGVWLVTWKRATGRPAPTYEEIVQEALCFGWIDSTAGTVDAERSRLWLAPRRPRSGWSRSNKARVALLEEQGLLAPAGREVVAAAQADGSWSLLDAVESLVVPDDLATALAAHPPAREVWDGFPRSARRAILDWIVQAKREPTRARRVAETAECAARGERANQGPRRKDPGDGRRSG